MAAVVGMAADAAPAGHQAEAGERPTSALDVDAIESRVERSLARKVRRLIDDFPERALDVVRGWLAEDR